jgi:hypothetical protein
MTQNNLGCALSGLGERESGTARLEEAVASFRDALKELTRERVPIQWAVSTGNQGVILPSARTTLRWRGPPYFRSKPPAMH